MHIGQASKRKQRQKARERQKPKQVQGLMMSRKQQPMSSPLRERKATPAPHGPSVHF